MSSTKSAPGLGTDPAGPATQTHRFLGAGEGLRWGWREAPAVWGDRGSLHAGRPGRERGGGRAHCLLPGTSCGAGLPDRPPHPRTLKTVLQPTSASLGSADKTRGDSPAWGAPLSLWALPQIGYESLSPGLSHRVTQRRKWG